MFQQVAATYGGSVLRLFVDGTEVSKVNDLFRAPLHPYSQLLIASLPTLEVKGAAAPRGQ